jgi:uncharacterized protein (DUF302 family)
MSVALITAHSRYDVPTTVELLTTAVQRRDLTVFATIDHGGAARAAGLQLSDEVVLVLGNPAGGTPLMQADPRSGIDLPLRILVWSHDGETRVAFRDPRAMADEFSLADHAGTLAGMRRLLSDLVAEVTS